MPRKKTIDPANETIFSSRFCSLMDSHRPKLTHDEMGKILGVSKSSIGFYRDGTNQPNYSILIKIADYFNCSTDYLLGRTDYSGTDTQLRMICDFTGLSENSVKDLRRTLKDKYEDDLTRTKRKAAFSGLVDSVYFSELLDSVQYMVDRINSIGLYYYDVPSVDSLAEDQLRDAATEVRNDLDDIEFHLYKQEKFWGVTLNDIIEYTGIVDMLKMRLSQIYDRMKTNSADAFLKLYKEELKDSFNEIEDN